MRAFRIDNREFSIENVITPQQLYQQILDEKRNEVERILEENRPREKPSRNSILMLFPDFDDAKGHWTLQRNSKFYKVEINENDILHIGDYNKVEELFKNLDNLERANQIAKEYWNCENTQKPKFEIFINCAVVSRVESNSEDERKNAFALRNGLGNPKIKIIVDEG